MTALYTTTRRLLAAGLLALVLAAPGCSLFSGSGSAPPQDSGGTNATLDSAATPDAGPSEENATEPVPVASQPEAASEQAVDTSIPEADLSEFEYADKETLFHALQSAFAEGRFLGYEVPYNAFPDLPGDDTSSGAFTPPDNDRFEIIVYFFWLPDSPYHRQSFGYVIHDLKTNQKYGRFDSDNNGTFDQKSLPPRIQLKSYEQPATPVPSQE